MSDLFAPMNLPSRPVQQTADIAEREAANRNREIDTRMRERIGTAAGEMERELKQIEVDEQERLYAAELERQRKAARKMRQQITLGLGKRPSTFNKSIAGIANQQLADSQNPQQAGQLEKARLDTQHNGYDFYLFNQRNDILTKMVTGQIDNNQAVEMWQGIVQDGGDRLHFDMHPYFSGYTTSAMTKANKTALTHTKWLFGKAHEADRSNRVTLIEQTNSQQANSAGVAFSSTQDTDIEGDPLGLGGELSTSDSWNVYENTVQSMSNVTGRSIYDRGSDQWKRTNGHLEKRFANAAVLEARTSYLNELKNYRAGDRVSSITEHLNDALSRISTSDMWADAEAKGFITSPNKINGHAQVSLSRALQLERRHNVASLDELNMELMDGAWEGRPGSELYLHARNIGVPEPKAKSMAERHAKNEASALLELNDTFREAAELERLQSQTVLEDELINLVVFDREYLGTQEELTISLRRAEAMGELDEGAADRITSLSEKSMANLIKDNYSASFSLIDDYITTLSGDRKLEQRSSITTGYSRGLQQLFPVMTNGSRAQSLATIKHNLREGLIDRIRAGEEEGGARLTSDSMLEATARDLQRLSGHMKLTNVTRDKVTNAVFSQNQEAAPLQGYRMQALAPLEKAFGENIVERYGGEAALMDYQDLTPDRRASYAAKMIPWAAYSGDLEADTEANNTNRQIASELRASGFARSIEIDPIEREAIIQLANRGEFVTISLDEEQMLSNVSRLGADLTAAEDVELAVEDELSLGHSALFVEVEDPNTGAKYPIPTTAVETVVRTVENVALTVLAIAEEIGSRGLQYVLPLLEGIDLGALLPGNSKARFGGGR